MEADVSGPQFTDVTAAVVGSTGESARLVHWINLAWNDIQIAHTDWGWMRTQMPLLATLGVNNPTYSLTQCGITNFGAWARDSFRNYQTSAGINTEVFMEYMDYDSWRNSFLYGALRSAVTRPLIISIAPDKSLCFGPIADVGYTIVGDYFTGPVQLVNATDIPSLPVQFHMAIVYKAMMYYGSFMGAPEVLQRGQESFSKMMMQLDATRLPECLLTGAIA